MIIHLISCPRSISTALMYSFAQRSDMLVMDEPFYGVYLHECRYDHPGAMKIIESMSHDARDIVQSISSLENGRHLFVKNMASHFQVLQPEWFTHWKPVFLIRDPARIIASYSKVIAKPTIQDIGIERQKSLYDWYVSVCGKNPIVIDSTDILADSKHQLTKLCKALGISFDAKMLTWPPGPKPYDGIWAPHWYKTVHKTSGFGLQESSADPLPQELQVLYQSTMEAYRFLYEKAITK